MLAGPIADVRVGKVAGTKALIVAAVTKAAARNALAVLVLEIVIVSEPRWDLG
ncbi:hypothetical protein D3C85_1833200 [compost metagenome]